MVKWTLIVKFLKWNIFYLRNCEKNTHAHIFVSVHKILFTSAWWQDLKYTNCIPWKGVPSTKKGVLGMTLNCIWWWGSSSEDVRKIEYSFAAITSRSTVDLRSCTCQDPIYGSNRSVLKLYILEIFDAI